MIRIKRIDIGNYRSCIKTRVDIQTNLTTLIGVNGVGKSNILNSIQLLKRINRNRYFHQRNLKDSLSHSKVDIWFNNDGEDFYLKSDVYYDTDETNNEEIYSAELKIKNISKKKSRWTEIDADLYQYVDYVNRTRRNIDIVKEYSANKKLNIDATKIALDIITYLTNISYYSATQFSDPTKCPISLELEDSRPIRLFKKSSHDQFIFDLYRTYKTEGSSFAKYLNTVNQNGIGLIDDLTFFDHAIPSSSVNVRAGGQIQTIEKIKNIVVPSIKLDNLTLSPNQLSEGTFKTLALIFYILNDNSDLLLIEEPEVCVHQHPMSRPRLSGATSFFN